MIKFVNVTASCHRWKLSSADFKYVCPCLAISKCLLACSFFNETVFFIPMEMLAKYFCWESTSSSSLITTYWLKTCDQRKNLENVCYPEILYYHSVSLQQSEFMIFLHARWGWSWWSLLKELVIHCLVDGDKAINLFRIILSIKSKFRYRHELAFSLGSFPQSISGHFNYIAPLQSNMPGILIS